MLFEASPPVLSKGTAASPSFDVDFILLEEDTLLDLLLPPASL